MRACPVVVLVGILLTSASLSAQSRSDTSVVFGRVVDPSGGAIAAVAVEATAAGVRRSTRTSATGDYELTDLAAGTHRLVFGGPGFSPDVRGAVRLGVGERLRMDVTLQPATVTEHVEVRTDSTVPALPGGQLAAGSQLGVMGTRPLLDTPFTVQAYTSALVQQRQARTIADLLDVDAATRAGWSPGYTVEELSIRGFLFSMLDTTYGGLYGVLPPGGIPTESLDRIEVIKGPSAMATGAPLHNSVGGLVNVVPKRAAAEPTFALTTTFESAQVVGTHLDVGRRFAGDRLGVRVNGMLRRGDTAWQQQSLRHGVASVGVDYRGTRVRLSIDANYNDRRRDVPLWQLAVRPGFAIPAPPDAGTNYQQPWSTVDAVDTYGVIRAEADLNRQWTAFVTAGQLKSDLYYRVAIGSLLNDRGDIAQTFGWLPRTIDATSAEAGVQGVFQTARVVHRLSAAVSDLRQDSGALNAFVPGPNSNLYEPVFVSQPASLDVSGRARRSALQGRTSVSLADTVAVARERLQVTLGVRLQNLSTETFDQASGALTSAYDRSAVTPLTALVMKPRPDMAIYGSYVEGLLQPRAPGGAVNANEIFPVMRTRQTEAGVKVERRGVLASAAAFEITQPRAITDPVTLRYDASGEQRTRGVELNLGGIVARRLRVIGGLVALSAVQTRTAGGIGQGNTGIGVPRIQANLSGDWDIPGLAGLAVSGRAMFTGRQYADAANRQSIPNWSRFGLGGRFTRRARGHQVTIRADVENLLNDAVWASTARDLTLGSPRTVRLSVTFDRAPGTP